MEHAFHSHSAGISEIKLRFDYPYVLDEVYVALTPHATATLVSGRYSARDSIGNCDYQIANKPRCRLLLAAGEYLEACR
jgi:hypothetical protein